MSSSFVPNHELELAKGFVQQTGRHIFLTGKAGTGKTTFLKELQKTCSKRMIITAPTGVAALNAGGVTLHSFFQLPFGPCLPGRDFDQNQRQFKFSRVKKQIMQSLDLLIIDEISMVRGDVLDAVDEVLRRFRRSSHPFGGVQLLMIGDLHQLSPVVKPDEWEVLQEFYQSVYFFSSKALNRTQFVTIELQHIFRQSDETFVQLLNKVRVNRLDEACIQELNTRYCQDFLPDTEKGYITLTSHNTKAQNINEHKLQELAGEGYRFQAKVVGDFPEYIYPTSADMLLKRGAQVMFVRNDPSPDKRYYNGKIGKVSSISKDKIRVTCSGESGQITLEPLIWENITYTLDPQTKEIQEDVVGTFEQYPLKLAWAITIHKSQGLTFERAIIDARDAFAHGQVYVALSRCKSLEGIVLSSPLSAKGIRSDRTIDAFEQEVKENQPDQRQLEQAELAYQQQLLLECFDMSALKGRLGYLVRLVLGNARVVRLRGIEDIRKLEESVNQDIVGVGEIFRRELHRIFAKGNLPETDAHTLERTRKASRWFQDTFDRIFGNVLPAMHIETDNALLRKKLGIALENLKKEVAIKLAGIVSCEQGFSLSRYLQAVSKAEVDLTPNKVRGHKVEGYTESDISHPELYETLKDWRRQKAKKLKMSPHQIVHQQVAIQIAVSLPQTMAELKKIHGVGQRTIERFGQDLVDLVTAYRSKHGIEQVVLPDRSKDKKKGTQADSFGQKSADTKQITLDMFKQGIPPAQIAEERGLALSTIEGHLSYWVEQGTVDIHSLLSAERRMAIEQALSETRSNSLKEIKDKLDDDCSYGQIKLVLAHQNRSEQET
jgi:hypothetical protein